MSSGSSAADTGRVARPDVISVWDPLVRIFHWSLVGIIAFEILAYIVIVRKYPVLPAAQPVTR